MRHKYAVRTLFTMLFLLSFFLQVHLSSAAEKVSVQEILSSPDKYDGQEVSLQGNATKIQKRTSRRGNDFTTFALRDESGKGMNIFAFDHPPITDGQKVTVTGIYQKVKRVGKYTFYNEVEAKTVK